MKLEKWALIAEIVGGVAIVLSLIFVGLQIRSNTNVSRAVAYERNIDSINQWRLEIIDDPQLAGQFGEYAGAVLESATREEVETFRLTLAVNALFGVYENSYYATEYGVMAPEQWRRFEEQACLQRDNAIEGGLWFNVERLLTTEFSEFI